MAISERHCPGKLRDELLNVDLLDTVLETLVLANRWRTHCNTVRPPSALGYRPPAPEAIQPWRQNLEARATHAMALAEQVVPLPGSGYYGAEPRKEYASRYG